jgi:predicted DNA binding CopG/RHH family protein
MSTRTDTEEFDYDVVGTDEQYVSAAADQTAAIDDALGLQPISIRLQKGLLDNLKALAQLNGIGYQPLVRQILTRWVDCELKNVLRERLAQERAQGGLKDEPVVLEESEPHQYRMAA